MKTFKTLILLGLVVSFYSIQIRYDDSPIESLGSGLVYSLTTGYLLYTYNYILIFYILYQMECSFYGINSIKDSFHYFLS